MLFLHNSVLGFFSVVIVVLLSVFFVVGLARFLLEMCVSDLLAHLIKSHCKQMCMATICQYFQHCSGFYSILLLLFFVGGGNFCSGPSFLHYSNINGWALYFQKVDVQRNIHCMVGLLLFFMSGYSGQCNKKYSRCLVSAPLSVHVMSPSVLNLFLSSSVAVCLQLMMVVGDGWFV